MRRGFSGIELLVVLAVILLMVAIIVLTLMRAKAQEEVRKALPDIEGAVVKGWEYKGPHNSSFYVMEIEIDGVHYLVLQDGGTVRSMIPKVESKPEKVE